MAFAPRFPRQTINYNLFYSKNVKKIQNKFNNGITKAFKPSNKAFLGMSDYK